MLNEAHRRRSYGEDVVVGFVETHGRRATQAMVDGLELLPRKRVEYRGVIVEELDVDAVLRRRPAVCLVDELAHTNAPGSEREKRYEDVEVILDAGINVVSTLNIQHLESLNDRVQALTGIRVRETIPDRIVDDADEIILIDLVAGGRARAHGARPHLPARAGRGRAPELLQAAEPRRAARAGAPPNGAGGRRAARRVHARVRAKQHVEVEEHVLVFIDAGTFSRTLIRRGWRLAQALRADLYVAYIKRELRIRSRRTSPARSSWPRTSTHASCPLEAGDEALALRGFIAAHGVNHLVLPYRRRGGFARLRKRSLADQLMRSLPSLDVLLVAEQ